MSMDASGAARRAAPRERSGTGGPLDRDQQMAQARAILKAEGEAVLSLADRLPANFCRALDLMYHCAGSVIVTGMGKAGLIGQKIAATLSSTGTNAHFLHPAEAIHGDLGRIHARDLVLMLSFSGATEEVVRLLGPLTSMKIPIIAMTGKASSPLGRQSTLTLDLGPLEEACELGLAPSTSTTAMLALGDALALVLSRMRSFGPDDFARFHPGGSLGRKLARVEEVMRPLTECRVASPSHTVRQVLVEVGRPGRRSGAVMLTDTAGTLAGLFTDSDLARLLEARRDEDLDRPIREVMTHAPTTVPQGTRLSEAIQMMAERKISELPVVGEDHRPLGMIDITDVVELSLPEPSGSGTANDDRPATLPFPHPSRDSQSK